MQTAAIHYGAPVILKYEKICKKLKKILSFCFSMSTTRLSCSTIDLDVFYSNHVSELELHQCDTLVSYVPRIAWEKSGSLK